MNICTRLEKYTLQDNILDVKHTGKSDIDLSATFKYRVVGVHTRYHFRKLAIKKKGMNTLRARVEASSTC